ncbi:MAG: sulfurtransferase TusA family protein [Asgard group archaeon]|nr:sulfurtransferase TusA family protein [Asgard group archaeon]
MAIDNDEKEQIDLEISLNKLECLTLYLILTRNINKIGENNILQVNVTDSNPITRVKKWCNKTGNELFFHEQKNENESTFYIKRKDV